MSILTLVILTALLAAGLWFAWYLLGTLGSKDPQPSYEVERDRMPTELATARLIMSEKPLSATLDDILIPLRTEQVFQTRDGRIIPVENKNRNLHKVYPYDVIQLTAQSLALAQDPRAKVNPAKVSDYGYLRTQNRRDGTVQYHPVKLLTKARMQELAERYFSVRTGRTEARFQPNQRACSKCPQQAKCPRFK